MSHSKHEQLLKRGVCVLAGGFLLVGGVSASAYASGSGQPAVTAGTGSQHSVNTSSQANCEVPPKHDPAVINTVHDVAVEQGVSEKVMVAAFEAGWVASHMNNLDCGESLGVFQQAPGEVWGTPEQCMDPAHATTKFLEHAVANEKNNPDFTPGELAQSVQRSAYPGRYDQAEDKARELIKEAEAA